MKLIDFLVQELPKLGGWPNDAKQAWQSSSDGEVYFDGFNDERVRFIPELIYLPVSDNPYERIQREQYEDALVASQKQAWNGEGLPPVGTECEAKKQARHNENIWVRVKIMYMSEFTAVMKELEVGATGEQVHHPRTLDFRPIRTEAERKREEAIKFMSSVFRDHVDNKKSNGQESVFHAIYDAFKAGKFE